MPRNVLITGASHGIGAACAVAFAKEDCQIGINYCKDRAGAEQTAALARAQGVAAEIYQADVSCRADCSRMMADFLARFGTIDVLVNNAGGALQIPPGTFADLPLDYWDDQIRLNLSAAAYCAQPAIRNMIDNHIRGKIINISSIHSVITWVRRKLLPYSAAKAGLNMFTKSLAVEVARYGINVNAIAPGFVMTKLSDRYSEQDLIAFTRKIPAGFLGQVGDITPLVLFLADDSKSRYIVGQTFIVDGGQTIDGVIDSMMA
jgi:NAD(P)-dependent dehydrogenase (short-subunit alcohol dehydrogenase family)